MGWWESRQPLRKSWRARVEKGDSSIIPCCWMTVEQVVTINLFSFSILLWDYEIGVDFLWAITYLGVYFFLYQVSHFNNNSPVLDFEILWYFTDLICLNLICPTEMSVMFSPHLHLEKLMRNSCLYLWDGLGCHRQLLVRVTCVSIILSSLEQLKWKILWWLFGQNAVISRRELATILPKVAVFKWTQPGILTHVDY